MRAADQAIRDELMAKGWDNVDSSDVARQDAVDLANQEQLERIIHEYGWPRSEMVGTEGVKAAFLIVQHGELPFQKKMLNNVETAFRAGDLEGQDLALLTDRVLKKEGNPQRYGTQADMIDGEIVVWPVEDEDIVDSLRSDLGMPSMADYVKILERVYGNAEN